MPIAIRYSIFPLLICLIVAAPSSTAPHHLAFALQNLLSPKAARYRAIAILGEHLPSRAERDGFAAGYWFCGGGNDDTHEPIQAHNRQSQPGEPVEIWKARKFIEEHSAEAL